MGKNRKQKREKIDEGQGRSGLPSNPPPRDVTFSGRKCEEKMPLLCWPSFLPSSCVTNPAWTRRSLHVLVPEGEGCGIQNGRDEHTNTRTSIHTDTRTRTSTHRHTKHTHTHEQRHTHTGCVVHTHAHTTNGLARGHKPETFHVVGVKINNKRRSTMVTENKIRDSTVGAPSVVPKVQDIQKHTNHSSAASTVCMFRGAR